MVDVSPALHRANLLQKLREHPQWDVVVIGGGATGLGCALDAVTRGYSVLLLEAGDFGRGTSSRSTKLIHGGVRYLAQGRIHLVREALLERARLLRNAPHLVKAMRFVVPAYSRLERAKLVLGLSLYDLLAGRHGIQPCRVLDAEATMRAIPTLKPLGLSGGVAYWDAQFDDARLVVSLMRSVFEHGGLALNYLPVSALLKENSRVVGVRACDVETAEGFDIRARVLINATGVWADRVRELDAPRQHLAMRPSQGIHLVVDSSFLPGTDGLLVPQTRDGRLLFVIPWHRRVLLGTTDTPRDDAPFEPRPLPGEIDFILETASGYLSKAPDRQDVRSVFCGLRPLLGGGDSSTSGLSREHRIERSAGGLYSIMGGKWTTYRLMAEDTLDRVLDDKALPRRQCVTHELRLHGAGSVSAAPASIASGLDECADSGDKLVLPTEDEIRHAARHELARSIEDVLARRIRLLFLDAAAALEAAPAVARVLARELDWNADRIDAELASFAKLANGMML